MGGVQARAAVPQAEVRVTGAAGSGVDVVLRGGVLHAPAFRPIVPANHDVTIRVAGVSGTGLMGRADVTVRLAATPPTGSNEPAGYTTLLDRSFDAMNEGGNTAYYGGEIVTDPTSPHSASNVMRVTNYAPSLLGYGVILEGPYAAANQTRMYVRWYMKLQAGWQAHSIGYKLPYPHHSGTHGVVMDMICNGPDYTTAPITLKFYPQSTVGASVFDSNIATPPITRGVWQKYELLMEMNTPGVANGVVKWWVDGTLCGSHTDVGLANAGESGQWALFRFIPYAGGSTGDPLAADQYLWLDGLYVSTKA